MSTNHQGEFDPTTRRTGTSTFMALLLVLVIAVSACGGNAAETVALPTESGQAASVEAPTAEPAEVQQPTAAVPTDEPPTAEPEPTDVPGPTVEPTAESAGVSLPDGLCANPYFPVVDGAIYTYQSEVPDLGPSTFSFKFANVTPTSFDMILGDESADFVTYTWQCLEDGLLSPNVQLNVGGPEMTIETLEATGITFPTPDNVAIGHSWTSRYVIQTTIGDMGAGAMQMHQTMEMVNEIVAIEPVTTPYGSFDEAIKVESTGSMEIITSMGEVEMPAMIVDMSSNTWYVEDVGRVRSEDLSDIFGTGEPTPTITELISIEYE